MKIENYTGRTLSVARSFGSTELAPFEGSADKQAKLVTPGGPPPVRETILLDDGSSIDVHAQLGGEIVGLPAPVEGTIYLVTLPVHERAVATGRTDTRSMGIGRFVDGKQVACEGLSSR